LLCLVSPRGSTRSTMVAHNRSARRGASWHVRDYLARRETATLSARAHARQRV
jgi:hypothetical protein